MQSIKIIIIKLYAYEKEKKLLSAFPIPAILLIIATVVIYNMTEGYAQLLAFIPFCAIIPLGIWPMKLEDKQENTPPSNNYRYSYPKK